MKLFETFLVAMSTYSSLPMPQLEWNEKNMLYAICFFPAVGVVCSGALLLWNWFCCRLNVNPVLFAAAAVCLPLFITGGIHMDGYMDTVDALASHQSRERKLEILKDSHTGAFSVISVAFLLLGYYAFMSQALSMGVDFFSLCLIPVVSRCCSSLAVWQLKSMTTSQYAKSRTPRWCIVTVWLLLLGLLMAGLLLFGRSGAALAVAAAGYSMALCRAYRLLDGMNGDISGFCICISELCAAAALILL